MRALRPRAARLQPAEPAHPGNVPAGSDFHALLPLHLERPNGELRAPLGTCRPTSHGPASATRTTAVGSTISSVRASAPWSGASPRFPAWAASPPATPASRESQPSSFSTVLVRIVTFIPIECDRPHSTAYGVPDTIGKADGLHRDGANTPMRPPDQGSARPTMSGPRADDAWRNGVHRHELSTNTGMCAYRPRVCPARAGGPRPGGHAGGGRAGRSRPVPWGAAPGGALH